MVLMNLSSGRSRDIEAEDGLADGVWWGGRG